MRALDASHQGCSDLIMINMVLNENKDNCRYFLAVTSFRVLMYYVADKYKSLEHNGHETSNTPPQ